MFPIKCFIDVSLGKLPTGKSLEVSVIIISGKYGNCSLVNWKSRTIKRLLQRSVSFETCTMVNILDVFILISYFMMYSLKEILCRPFKRRDSNNQFEACTDSKYLYHNVHSTTMPDKYRMRISIIVSSPLKLGGSCF